MMNQQIIKLYEIGGTPYEIGFQHGSLAAVEVKRSIATYQDMFISYSNLEWQEAKRRSLAYVNYINQFDPSLMQEMQGIADGAKVELEDILALNARSEVIMMQAASIDGCTSIAALPESTANGHSYLAQNWDWRGTQLDSLILLKIIPQNGPQILMVTEAGILGKIGFNSEGLGVCLNALSTVGVPDGIPLHIVLRGILGCGKISDALEKINLLPNACAANYLIAHKNGEAIDVEKISEDFDVFYAEKDYLAHTNHFMSLKLKVVDMLRLISPDSYIRVGRTNKLLAKGYGSIDESYIKTILTDHVEYPDSICRHNDPLNEPQFQMCTVFSIIMDLTDSTMLVAKGAPCENPYVKFHL